MLEATSHLRPGGVEPSSAVYLDGFATMPIAPEARAAIVGALELPANPSSPHGLGERAADLVDRARRAVAELAGCGAAELTFTSGATEANNLAIVGGARAALRSTARRRVVVSAIEHRSVLEPAASLAALGFEVVHAPVGRDGVVDLGRLGDLVDERCWLVSVMAVNNETGALQPVAETAAIARSRGALMHTDVAQALGKVPVDLARWNVDYASLSAHKAYGPVGVGAFYVAAGAPLPDALQLGGGQQGGRRAGTEPVALIAGFGAAAEVAASRLVADRDHAGRLSALLLDELRDRQVRVRRTTGAAPTVPGGMSLYVDGADADDIAMRLQEDVYLSTGSACSSGQITTSHVLLAMGLDTVEARSVIRVMLNRYLSENDITAAADRVARAVVST